MGMLTKEQKIEQLKRFKDVILQGLVTCEQTDDFKNNLEQSKNFIEQYQNKMPSYIVSYIKSYAMQAQKPGTQKQIKIRLLYIISDIFKRNKLMDKFKEKLMESLPDIFQGVYEQAYQEDKQNNNCQQTDKIKMILYSWFPFLPFQYFAKFQQIITYDSLYKELSDQEKNSLYRYFQQLNQTEQDIQQYLSLSIFKTQIKKNKNENVQPSISSINTGIEKIRKKQKLSIDSNSQNIHKRQQKLSDNNDLPKKIPPPRSVFNKETPKKQVNPNINKSQVGVDIDSFDIKKISKKQNYLQQQQQGSEIQNPQNQKQQQQNQNILSQKQQQQKQSTSLQQLLQKNNQQQQPQQLTQKQLHRKKEFNLKSSGNTNIGQMPQNTQFQQTQQELQQFQQNIAPLQQQQQQFNQQQFQQPPKLQEPSPVVQKPAAIQSLNQMHQNLNKSGNQTVENKQDFNIDNEGWGDENESQPGQNEQIHQINIQNNPQGNFNNFQQNSANNFQPNQGLPHPQNQPYQNIQGPYNRGINSNYQQQQQFNLNQYNNKNNNPVQVQNSKHSRNQNRNQNRNHNRNNNSNNNNNGINDFNLRGHHVNNTQNSYYNNQSGFQVNNLSISNQQQQIQSQSQNQNQNQQQIGQNKRELLFFQLLLNYKRKYQQKLNETKSIFCSYVFNQTDKKFIEMDEFKKNLYIVPNFYDNLPYLCYNCGLRFEEREEIQQHYNNHFKENYKNQKGKKSDVNKAFYSEDEWINCDIQHDKQDEDEDMIEEINLPYIEAQYLQQNKCELCSEEMILDWNNEIERWVYLDCMLVKIQEISLQNKIGVYPFHSICYKILQEQQIEDDDKDNENEQKSTMQFQNLNDNKQIELQQNISQQQDDDYGLNIDEDILDYIGENLDKN
ncbi:hypothetical protein PPERSA_12557 [Pseudocohnilembus persalinus]|uniref:C2H2-type domain-containing protein n=1 Tax=Pseudocohnilembus persalinus TaxID=266149 RepID=A0A0V0QCC8_PSEPJ|nr:hypothetical protein PPERSA_12557 [Pseudocohnilembus persalinus]|eukprot:KRW99881.1 hypothetical protein PPERSA_12557 [Pseudocohnilembus persalinus]